MNKNYLIMCVGHTHSGKTTFAKKLSKKIKDLLLIDNDDIAFFVNQKYPQLALSDFNKKRRTLKNPNLKFLLLQNIIDFALQAKVNLLLSNGNLGKDIRSVVRKKAKEYNYEFITVFFNLPRKELLKRIGNSKKDKRVFVRSHSWEQVYEKQKKYADLPPSKRNTIYFEINRPEDEQAVFKKLGELLA